MEKEPENDVFEEEDDIDIDDEFEEEEKSEEFNDNDNISEWNKNAAVFLLFSQITKFRNTFYASSYFIPELTEKIHDRVGRLLSFNLPIHGRPTIS